MTAITLAVCALAALTLAVFTGWFVFHEHQAKDKK